MAGATFFRATWVRVTAGAIIALAALLLIVVAAFPWGLLKGVIESRLTQRFGRPVSIGSIERLDRFGLHPRIAIRAVRIPQAGWAGSGDFVRLDQASATFSLPSLLIGRFAPQDVRVDGLTLDLARDTGGRTNWSRPGESKSKGGGGGVDDLKGLVVRNATIRYRDAKQDRQILARFDSDPVNGVRAAGKGTIRGAPVMLAVKGPSVESAGGKPWPFTASIDGRDLAMTATGTMDRPLDTDAMTIDVTARATSLKLVDAVIEAGLFGTQPVRLTAHVRHDAPDWTVTKLSGRIGITDIAGGLTVKKRDGRTHLDGEMTSRQLAFEDFSDDEGLAKGAALERQIGPRIVPNTRINLAKIRTTDGTIGFHVGRIVGRDGSDSSIRALRGSLSLDHQRLVIAPFAMAMRKGQVTGRIVVDQKGAPAPTLSVDLRLVDSSVPALGGGGGSVTGQVDGHARLTGIGSTVREAIGRSDGAIGLVARDGQLPERIAAGLGFDAGRALLAGKDERAGLRCVILKLAVTNGRGVTDPLIIDTTASQLHGTGTITFPDERIAIRLTGAPKRNSLLRLPGSAYLTGTMRLPDVVIPPEVKSAGNIFKAIGRAIKGTQGPSATDADCTGLAARVLR